MIDFILDIPMIFVITFIFIAAVWRIPAAKGEKDR